MNQEQSPIVEKEITPEDIKEYFDQELDFHEDLIHKTKDIGLKDGVGDRRERLIDYIEKFENKDYKECLAYIEEVLGAGSAASGNTYLVDLVNHRRYGLDIHRDRDKDIEEKEYQAKKNQLRKFADILAGDAHKEELEEKPSLKTRELLGVLESIASRTDQTLSQVEKEIGGDDREKALRETLEYLDDKVYGELSQIERAEKKDIEQKIQLHQEKLLKWRRYRRFFLNLQEKKE